MILKNFFLFHKKLSRLKNIAHFKKDVKAFHKNIFEKKKSKKDTLFILSTKNYKLTNNAQILKTKNFLRGLENICENIDFIQIKIASPERINNWSSRITNSGNIIKGIIFKPDTVDYFTLKPIKFGLFCETAFGPIKDWTCSCTQFSHFLANKKLRRIFCPVCNVELTESRVRRYRMGQIPLPIPIAHVWYLMGRPSYIATVLSHFFIEIGSKKKEQVNKNLVIDIAYCINQFPIQRTSKSPLKDTYLNNYLSYRKNKIDNISYLYQKKLNKLQSAQKLIAKLLRKEYEFNYKWFFLKQIQNIYNKKNYAQKSKYNKITRLLLKNIKLFSKNILFNKITDEIKICIKIKNIIFLNQKSVFPGIIILFIKNIWLKYSQKFYKKNKKNFEKLLLLVDNASVLDTLVYDNIIDIVSGTFLSYIFTKKYGLNSYLLDETTYERKLCELFYDSSLKINNLYKNLGKLKDNETNVRTVAFNRKFELNSSLRINSLIDIGNFRGKKIKIKQNKKNVSLISLLKNSKCEVIDLIPVGSELLKTGLDDLDDDLINLVNNYRSYSLLETSINRLSTVSYSIKETESLVKRKSIFQRLRILESFLASRTKLSWMILTIIPVLPPVLRPIFELENGTLIAADLNEFYRHVICGIDEFKDFVYEASIQQSTFIEKMLVNGLQQAVDSLIDNARAPYTLTTNQGALKSLTQILDTKEGRFRLTLLGKRVDYSARTIIIVGPTLRLNQCSLPYKMVVELFRPFLINLLLKKVLQNKTYVDTKTANFIIDKNKPYIWLLLAELIKNYCVLLNRAPTLHRFGVQSFNPFLNLEQAIELHPLVCAGFNADFDGDQMAIHLPITDLAQIEADIFMRPIYNILSQSNGNPILKPTQDMVVGAYYLTLMLKRNHFLLQKWFANQNDALNCYYQKRIAIHQPILVRYSIPNFTIEISSKKIEIFDKLSIFFNKKSIIISKIYQAKKKEKIYFLLTNVGILIAKKKLKSYYMITEFFLETTPGRIIFNLTTQNNLKKNYI